MIETNKIIIDASTISTYVLTYYDGNKEEVDIGNNILFLWYDSYDDYEVWFKIKPNSSTTLKMYLNNEIGVRDVMQKSSIEIYKRMFEKYELFQKYNDFIVSDEFPENEKLGFNFFSVMN